MNVNFRQIKSGGVSMSFSESAVELDLDLDGVKMPEPIKVDLDVNKSGDEIIFQGMLSLTAELECSRCLEIFELPINSNLQFVVHLLDDIGHEDTGDDDFVVLPKTAQEYDISKRIREAIILGLPLKAICSDMCNGLCSMCGVNLNDVECDCTPDVTDERWDTLRQLLDE
jgi:uncharacterized protein